MKLFNFSRKTEKTDHVYRQAGKSGRFSDFFLHAPENKQEEVLREAARKANEQQQEVFTKSHLKAKMH